MSVTTVASLRSALGVGTLYADAALQEVCDASDDVMLPFLWSNEYFNYATENTTTLGTLYFSAPHGIQVGQSVTVSQNGAPYNGTFTVSEVTPLSVSYALTGSPAAQLKHLVQPLGTVSLVTYITYSTTPAVIEASLMISIAIWQARQAPSGQGMSVDGFTPSPFTMSNTLLARVRGLLAPFLSPRSMVG